MRFTVDAACGSTIGKVRSNNEDNFLFNGIILPQENKGQLPPLELNGEIDGDICLAVFDGMGGGDLGEVASHTASSKMKELLNSADTDDIEEFLRSATETMNQAVYDESSERNLYQMGTTAAIMYFHDRSVIVCNVGDSSVYGIRGDKLLKISLDHTDEEYMKKQGITGRKPRLTQYLGMDPMSVRIEPHVVTGSLNEGDIYIICSDGLTDMVSEERIKEIAMNAESSSYCVTALINEAMENGGRDNTTVVVCKIIEQKVEGELSEEPMEQVSLGSKLISGFKKFMGVQKQDKHEEQNEHHEKTHY